MVSGCRGGRLGKWGKRKEGIGMRWGGKEGFLGGGRVKIIGGLGGHLIIVIEVV